MADFYHRVARAEALKVAVDPENGIRLYCTAVNSRWALQVRSKIRLANGCEGKDFIVASATLTLEDLKALRDAINNEIEIATGERTNR